MGNGIKDYTSYIKLKLIIRSPKLKFGSIYYRWINNREKKINIIELGKK